MRPRALWVVPEVGSEGLRPAGAEAIALARDLAEGASLPLFAALVGTEVEALAPELFARGADQVCVLEDPALAAAEGALYARAVASCLEVSEPEAVLLAETPLGVAIAASLAMTLGAGLVTGCLALAYEEGLLRAWRETPGAPLRAQVIAQGTPAIYTLRPMARSPRELQAREGQPQRVVAPELEALTFLLEREEAPGPSLAEAPVVVVGGRGMGAAENFRLLERLAAELGGVVGATREVVRAGWRPLREQVGLTGAIVAPRLYVACGVRGASQHWAGMRASGRILAINSDPLAPLMQRADWAVVGDALEVVPRLIEAWRSL